MPLALLVAFGDEQVGTLLTGYATYLIACSILACACGNNHSSILANVCRAEVAALTIQFLGFLDDITARVLFPVCRLHCRLQTNLSHAVFGILLKESFIAFLRSLVVTFLKLRSCQVEHRHRIGITVAHSILICTDGKYRTIALAVALSHLPSYLGTLRTLLGRYFPIGFLVFLCRFVIFHDSSILVTFFDALFTAASHCKHNGKQR